MFKKFICATVSILALAGCGSAAVSQPIVNNSCPVPRPRHVVLDEETLKERRLICNNLYDHMLDLMTYAVIEQQKWHPTPAQKKMIKSHIANATDDNGSAGTFALTCFNEANKKQLECAMKSDTIDGFADCFGKKIEKETSK